MTTQINQSDLRDVIEHFRATGYEGSEPWVVNLNPDIGTRLIATRQMESCATQPACAWLDEADEESELWQLARECFLESLESFAQIIESTFVVGPSASVECGVGRQAFVVVFRAVSRLLTRLRTAEPSKTSYPETAIVFLLAVMVLRQIADADAQGLAVAQTRFLPFSTNVHPTFLPNLLNKCDSNLIDLATPILLPELAHLLENESRGEASPAGPPG